MRHSRAVPPVLVGLALAKYVHSHRAAGLSLLPNAPSGTHRLPCAPMGHAFGAGVPGFLEGQWRPYLPLLDDLTARQALDELAALIMVRAGAGWFAVVVGILIVGYKPHIHE